MIKLNSGRAFLAVILTLSLTLFFASCGGKKSSKSQSGLTTDKKTAKSKIDGLVAEAKQMEKLMAIQDGCIAGKTKEKFMAGFLASSAVLVSADLTDKVDENVAKVVGVDDKKFEGLDKICDENSLKLATALIQGNEEVQAAIGMACHEHGKYVTSGSIAGKILHTKAVKDRRLAAALKEAVANAGYSDENAAAMCASNPKTAEAAAGADAAKTSTQTDPNCP